MGLLCVVGSSALFFFSFFFSYSFLCDSLGEGFVVIVVGLYFFGDGDEKSGRLRTWCAL